MKKTYSLLIFLFFTGLSFGQNTIETDTKLIKNLITESFEEVFSGLNAKKMDKFYTNDFLLLENGVVQNKDSLSHYFNRALQEKIIPKRINTIEFIDVKISKGMAWVAYQNHAVWKHEETVYGKAHWLESATAIWTKEGWKLQMLHSTKVKIK